MVCHDRMLLMVMMVTVSASTVIFPSPSPEENDAGYWQRLMQEEVKEALNLHHNTKVAKNIILFLGDGMGVTVNTAGRILKGQKAGRSGEEGYLTWDRFPNMALLKTYLLDKQVADSAGSATAFLCGVKGNYETLGLTGRVRTYDCSASRKPGNQVHSILKWAQDAGKHTGLITTTQVTHATPAGLYAKTPQRKWQCDTRAKREGGARCKDIARQLVEDSPGRDMKVVLGGGRQAMGAPLDDGAPLICPRGDGRNLVEEWRQEKERRGEKAVYVTTTGELLDVDLNSTDYLMGLFGERTLPYHVDRKEGPAGTPSLLQMVEAALTVLTKAEYGFFLMVEGGHVDKGLHQNMAGRALEEVVQLDEAVALALSTLDLEETLVVVTADHSHTLTLSGYPPRGNHILGMTTNKEVTDGLPYTPLMFTTGQGFDYTWDGTKVVRKNLTGVDTTQKDYKFLAAVPATIWGGTHGGEDVSVHAVGPMSHLFHRVHEQTYVAHVMAYSACLGPYLHDCPRPVPARPAPPHFLNLSGRNNAHSDHLHSHSDHLHSDHLHLHNFVLPHNNSDFSHSDHSPLHSDNSHSDHSPSEHLVLLQNKSNHSHSEHLVLLPNNSDHSEHLDLHRDLNNPTDSQKLTNNIDQERQTSDHNITHRHSDQDSPIRQPGPGKPLTSILKK